MERCPANITVQSTVLPDAFGGPIQWQIQGPHHWVRVGTWTDLEVHITLNGGYTAQVDRPVYECVYCLGGKKQERPIVEAECSELQAMQS